VARAALNKCRVRSEALLRGPIQCCVQKFLAGVTSPPQKKSWVMWKNEARKGKCQAKGVWGHALRSTSLAETFHVRISVAPNKSKSFYTKYLHFGHVLTAGYDTPIGHLLNEFSNNAWYNHPAKINYKSFAKKINKRKNVTTGHHAKTTMQPLYDNAWNR